MNQNEAKQRFETLILKHQQISAQQTIEKFVFLLDPKQKLLCKGLIAWKNIKVLLDFSNPKEIENEIQFIWQFCKFDLKRFCMILQIENKDAINLINRLKNLDLIFPDGNVNTQAYALLMKFTQIQLQKKTGLNKKNDKESK